MCLTGTRCSPCRRCCVPSSYEKGVCCGCSVVAPGTRCAWDSRRPWTLLRCPVLSSLWRRPATWSILTRICTVWCRPGAWDQTSGEPSCPWPTLPPWGERPTELFRLKSLPCWYARSGCRSPPGTGCCRGTRPVSASSWVTRSRQTTPSLGNGWPAMWSSRAIGPGAPITYNPGDDLSGHSSTSTKRGVAKWSLRHWISWPDLAVHIPGPWGAYGATSWLLLP